MKKPFKTYFGGKESNGVYQTIINHIRPHDVFVEPFGGNFTVSRYLRNSIKAINDINFNVYSNYLLLDKKLDEYCFFNEDYKDFLKNLFELLSLFSQIPCIYFDPPYPLGSRKSSRKVYKHEMTDNDHLEFLAFCNSIKGNCDILISTYPNEMYKKHLKGWYLVEFDGMDRHGKTTEWLFMNYDPEKITELHDARYFGKNANERQFNKRTIKNAVEKLNRLHPILKKEILNRSGS